MSVRSRIGLATVAVALCLTTWGCESKQERPPLAGHPAEEAKPLADEPLATFRDQLLTMAFDTASAIPVDPHIKDRSRAQEAVIATCLTLGQPVRAGGYVEQMSTWRQGAAYADLAAYCARKGHADEADTYLALAARAMEQADDWQKDRIRVAMARVHAWLGRGAQADELLAGVEAAEVGKVNSVAVQQCQDEDFDLQVEALDQLVATGQFDTIRNALESYTQLFNRFYGDPARQALAEQRIRAAWGPLPLLIKLDLLMAMARSALDHGEPAPALLLVNETQRLMDEATWPPEHRIVLVARLATLRYRAGDQDQARSDCGAALALFATERESIVNIDRAETLCSPAEAYQAMGDAAAALAVYKQAVEQGVVNPNSRPRAEDLSATCLSMALHGAEPDAELWNRIRQIRAGLGQPW